MPSIAPYHVWAFTLTLAEAGAVTVTSNSYFAGEGAVIRYCAEERPAGRTRLAACDRPTAAGGRAIFVLWIWVPPSFPPALVHAVTVNESTPQTARTTGFLLMPPNLGDKN